MSYAFGVVPELSSGTELVSFWFTRKDVGRRLKFSFCRYCHKLSGTSFSEQGSVEWADSRKSLLSSFSLPFPLFSLLFLSPVPFLSPHTLSLSLTRHSFLLLSPVTSSSPPKLAGGREITASPEKRMQLHCVYSYGPGFHWWICRGSAENGGPEKAGPEFAGLIFRKMQDREMQDWISKDHFAGAMTLSSVKLCTSI